MNALEVLYLEIYNARRARADAYCKPPAEYAAANKRVQLAFEAVARAHGRR